MSEELGIYRWTIEASTKVKEVNSSKHCEAKSNAIRNIILLQVSRAENNVYTYKS